MTIDEQMHVQRHKNVDSLYHIINIDTFLTSLLLAGISLSSAAIC